MSLMQIRAWMKSPYFSRIRIRELKENKMITIFNRTKTIKNLEALVEKWRELSQKKDSMINLELSFRRELYPRGDGSFHKPEWCLASYCYPINSVILYLKEVEVKCRNSPHA